MDMKTFKEYAQQLDEIGPPPGLGGGPPGGISAPGSLPPGGPPGGGLGGPPPGPPPGGMMGGPPMGGPPGGPPMGGDPMQGGQQPQKSLPLNPTNVWDALEKILGGDEEGKNKTPEVAPKPPPTQHLQGSA